MVTASVEGGDPDRKIARILFRALRLRGLSKPKFPQGSSSMELQVTSLDARFRCEVIPENDQSYRSSANTVESDKVIVNVGP